MNPCGTMANEDNEIFLPYAGRSDPGSITLSKLMDSRFTQRRGTDLKDPVVSSDALDAWKLQHSGDKHIVLEKAN